MTITLRRVWRDYIRVRKLKKCTIAGYQKLLFRCAADWLALDITTINKEMVERKFQSLSGTPAQANYLFRILRALFTFAMHKYEASDGAPILNNNPVRRLSELRMWHKPKARSRYIPADKMPDWFMAVLMETNITLRDYILVLALTGLRKSEAANLEWRNVDLNNGFLRVDETKNGEPHLLPFSSWLWTIFKDRKTNSKYVFPGRGTNGCVVHPYEAIEIISKRAGCKFAPHDLRRTFIYVAKKAGVDPITRKQLVNHKFTDVTGRHYEVKDPEEWREAMELISMKYCELAKLPYMTHIQEKASFQ